MTENSPSGQWLPYKSKDFVIQGNNLILCKKAAWKRIHKHTRTAIKKARSYNPIIKEVEGNKENIKKFYPFCPSGKDLPEELKDNQRMYFAYLGSGLVGGIIVSEIDNHLFLHFLGVTEEGREKQISSILIWHIVEAFSNSEYEYLDMGASYKPSLQRYFSDWATEKYPIIMRPPRYKPQLRITPFENNFLEIKENPDFNVDEYLFKRFGEYTFFPTGMDAIYSLFKWLKPKEVCIKTTTESSYISKHITLPIEANCQWSREISNRTEAILVIHEFGFSHPKIKELKEISLKRKTPLIEDCAWGFTLGDYGDYLIYSFPKVFPMQFGGLLAGKKFEHQYIWDNFQCLDLEKEEICRKQLSVFLPELNGTCQKRRENYQFYRDIFKNKTFFKLEDTVPGVFVLKVEDEKKMKEASGFMRRFGIECGNYYYNNAIFFPVHQNLNKAQLEYIAGTVKATYREGCGL